MLIQTHFPPLHRYLGLAFHEGFNLWQTSYDSRRRIADIYIFLSNPKKNISSELYGPIRQEDSMYVITAIWCRSNQKTVIKVVVLESISPTCLRAVFTCAIPEKLLELTVFFALLGSASVKVACKMMVKLTPGVDFTIMLCAGCLTLFYLAHREGQACQTQTMCGRHNEFYSKGRKTVSGL